MKPILLEDIAPIAYQSPKDIVFTLSGETAKDSNEPTFALRVFCDGSMKYCFGIFERMTKFSPFDEIEKGEEPISSFLHDRIGKTFDGKRIFKMMNTFREEYEKFEALENKWSYDFTPVMGGKTEEDDEK